MKTFRKIQKTLISLQKHISVFLCLSIVFLVIYPIALKYVFHIYDIEIGKPLLLLTAWLYMLGGANASQKHNHIECGIMSLYAGKEKNIELIKILKGAVSIAICAWLLYWACQFFIFSAKQPKTDIMPYTPILLEELALCVGIFLMLIYTISEFIENIKKRR